MNNYFYEEHYTLEKFEIHLDNIDIKKEHKEHIIKISKETVHTKSLDFVLDELKKDEKKHEFLSILNQSGTKEALEYLDTELHKFEERFIRKLKEFERELIELLD